MKVVDFKSTKAVKDFIETASNQIQNLEAALYDILEMTSLQDAKEVAAEALGEDLDTYLEEDDLEELDFESEKHMDKTYREALMDDDQ